MSMQNTSGLIIAIWLILYFTPASDIFYYFTSGVLSENFKERAKNSNYNGVYKFLYSKKYVQKDYDFISKLKVNLKTYIHYNEHKNKGLLNNIITIIISAMVTITITQYTLQSQMDKELISKIIDNLNNDFITVLNSLMIIYGIYGILGELSSIKYKYYIMVKNIMDEVEKDRPRCVNYYTSYINKEI